MLYNNIINIYIFILVRACEPEEGFIEPLSSWPNVKRRASPSTCTSFLTCGRSLHSPNVLQRLASSIGVIMVINYFYSNFMVSPNTSCDKLFLMGISLLGCHFYSKSLTPSARRQYS